MLKRLGMLIVLMLFISTIGVLNAFAQQEPEPAAEEVAGEIVDFTPQ